MSHFFFIFSISISLPIPSLTKYIRAQHKHSCMIFFSEPFENLHTPCSFSCMHFHVYFLRTGIFSCMTENWKKSWNSVLNIYYWLIRSPCSDFTILSQYCTLDNFPLVQFKSHTAFVMILFLEILFFWLCWGLAVARGILSCGTQDLVPWPGIEPRFSALGT